MGQPQPAQPAQTSQTTFGFRRWNYIRSHCRVHHHSTVICRKEIILFLHSFCKVHIFWDGHKNLNKSPTFFLTITSKEIGRFFQIFLTFSEYMNFSSDFEGFTWNSPSILSGKGRSKTELLTIMHLFWRGLSGEIVKTPLPFILPLTNVPSKSYLEYEIGKHGFVIARPEGQWISKYEIKSIWNCFNFSQNTNKRHYSEQLYRLQWCA